MEFKTLYEKVMENIDDMFSTFITKRAAGAKNLEDSARSKGKYAILTAYHFAGKAKPYAESLRFAKKEECSKLCKEKYKEALSNLRDIDSLTQKEFQMLSGVLEVWGEVYLQNKDPKDYSK